LKGIRFATEVPIALDYKDVGLECGFRADFVVDDQIVVELKAIDDILPIHKSQLLTYMRLSGLKTGLLINFNVRQLKQGIKRMII
jgi:GxxExxY protein